jgi:LCP family protein required for cell wall assembly
VSKRTRSGRLRRTWPQRLLITFNLSCIVLALLAAGSLTYAKRKVGEIPRVQFSADGFIGSDGLADDAPRNFLIVGNDSAAELDADDPARAGRGSVGGVRSDTMMVVRLDPESKRAKILSFPRDLWVEIPGRGRNRINASIEYGGRDLLVQTIKENFDIDINHYVEVDFAGFKDMVDLLGGVPVYFATPVRDTRSGLNVENAGCTTLDENGALHYVRARHLRYYDEERDRWVSDPTSDLGRISRQQDFIKRVIRRAVSQGARDPLQLRNYIEVGLDNITLDGATTPGDLIELGQAFRTFDPETLQTFSLPVSDAYRGGAQVLELRTAEAEPILAMFRGTGKTTTVEGDLAPSSVAVAVLNGSGAQNQAAEASDVLAQAGFAMRPPSSTAGVERTEVRYRPGQEDQAVLVARHLFADPILIADEDVEQLTVITGPDFGAALVEARPVEDVAVPTTTTAAPVSGSTTVVPEGDGSATAEAPSVTTTTAPGFVPPDPPPGVDCG